MKNEDECREPAYWLKRRTKIAFWHNIGPIMFVTGMLVAFLITGLLEVSL
jgi:hypothetical protein